MSTAPSVARSGIAPKTLKSSWPAGAPSTWSQLSWQQDEVAFLNEWNAFLPKACMALIAEQNRYPAMPGRH
jgi:hypothetical protein